LWTRWDSNPRPVGS